MKIVLLGHKEIASNLALSLLARRLAQHDLTILLSGTDPQPLASEPAIRDLEQFECDACDRLAATGADSPIQSFAGLAALTGKPIGMLGQPNSPAGVEQLKQLAPDLVFSARYRKVLRPEFIAVPKYGVLNWHSGLLPEYQGIMATFWAMRNGEAQIGSTLHYIVDGGIDTGPLVARMPMPRQSSASFLGNVLALYPAGCARVVNAIEIIARVGKVACEPQGGEAHYYATPEREHMAAFSANGDRLFDIDDVTKLCAGLVG